jgi:hypothetical protein
MDSELDSPLQCPHTSHSKRHISDYNFCLFVIYITGIKFKT